MKSRKLIGYFYCNSLKKKTYSNQLLRLNEAKYRIILKPRKTAKINLFLLFVILCILYYLHFRRVQQRMFIRDEIEAVDTLSR